MLLLPPLVYKVPELAWHALRLRYRPAKVKLKLSGAARRFWETCITMYLYAKHSYLMKKITALFPFPPFALFGFTSPKSTSFSVPREGKG